ncbi:MAG TPA: DNRLRE domain-containing protein [Bryobacteraceae bacterium]|nr:DNRLRE domain-containing protein [Bryobacteraceae bacterium]
MKKTMMKILRLAVLSASLLIWAPAFAQVSPVGDAYTNTAKPKANNGAATLLSVDGATEITYIQFDLSSIPATADISQATLKLYVNGVATAGTFNVNYVTNVWSESTINTTNAPPVGTPIASDVSVTTAEANQYILVNITSAVQAWLSGSQTNNGIALVANGTFSATFDSKENTTTSHPPELDIAYASGTGTITGVTTASGSGLSGGGTSGTLNLSLTMGCASGQVLSWNGSAWVCTALGGGGTITGVTAGPGLMGGGTSGNVLLYVNSGVVPFLSAFNNFTQPNTFSAPTTFSTTGVAATIQVLDSSSDGQGGVNGQSANGIGVFGYGPLYVGVQGSGPTGVYGYGTNSSSVGVSGNGTTGVLATGITTGVSASGTTGVYAQGTSVGVEASGATGIYAQGTGAGYAVDAYNTVNGTGVLAGSYSGWAGWFNGNLEVDGSLSKAGGSFKIDHPLDPANKYLFHSFVESPDMMNIYNGNVITDSSGTATVAMPDWFEALNRDFRYQLTVIGQFAQAIVASKISNGSFMIKTDKPNVEVSWQVTGIRQDAWANAHRIPVEQEKPELERGYYIHPELYGAPEEKGILWATTPETMQRWKEARTKPAAAQPPAKPVRIAKPVKP